MHSSRGMSLIEALVWITIFTFAMGAISTSILYFYRHNRYTLEEAFAVTSAQQGIDTSVALIRAGAYSAQGAFPIVSIAANDFVFYADANGDGRVDRVHFYLQGTKLMRGVKEASGNPPDYTGSEVATTMAQYVRNTEQGVSTFRYYDALGTEIVNYANWSSVRSVKVTLVVNVNTTLAPNQLSLYSTAAIRNLIGR